MKISLFFLCLYLHVTKSLSVSPVYMNISDGIPISNSLSNQQIQYYRFIAPLPLPRTDIVLSPIFGSFTILVTMGPYWDPEPGNSEWTASTVTSDALIQNRLIDSSMSKT